MRQQPKVSRTTVTKARQVLEFAEQLADQAADWMELSNALFGPDGQATRAFPTEAARTAFCKTHEYRQILALMDRLPSPPVKEFIEVTAPPNGGISGGDSPKPA